MEDRYYTPSIEEFHIGFEYEKFDKHLAGYMDSKLEFINTNWHRLKYDLNSIRLSQIPVKLNDKTIRVKYLDKEDIEFFGFEEIGQEEYTIGLPNSIWTIEKLYDEKIKSFYRLNDDDHQILFLEIKNKSELKKLLIQLQIIKQ